jgi:hypothetical protein
VCAEADGVFADDLYKRNVVTNVQSSVEPMPGWTPRKSFGYAIEYDFSTSDTTQGSRRLFVFGGQDASGAFLNDFLFLDFQNLAAGWTVVPQSQSPPARSSMSLIRIGIDTVVVFGGLGASYMKECIHV